MPTLYVVATPIGNLEDVTLRALRVLGEVDLIAAEDTRTTRRLLRRYGIKTPLVSYYEDHRATRIPQLLQRLEQGDVALVSDAGTPGVRDPGLELVQAAAERGVPVVPLPGPSAVTASLAVAGLPADRFLFLGFLPRRRKERRALLERVAREPSTLVAFEAPHRLRASLEDMVATLGDRPATVCRELSKRFEEVYRATLEEALAHFQVPRGEFTLVIAGYVPVEADQGPPEDAARERLRALRVDGASAQEAVGAVARELGLSRRQVYRLWLEVQERS